VRQIGYYQEFIKYNFNIVNKIWVYFVI